MEVSMSSQAATVPGPLARLAELPREAAVSLALGLDAAITGLNGLIYVALADVIDGPLGLSASLLRPAGAFLIAFALVLAYLATRRRVRTIAVEAVIAINAIWVIESVVALAFGWIEPTLGGGVWVALQAIVVAGFAALQYLALRRAPAT
jgi:hypothetical protein